MIPIFYLTALIAIWATIMVITRLHAVHALVYLVISLLAVALMFFLLGAPFAAALEVIVYAGAIMMLFVFTMMMLNIGEPAIAEERKWLTINVWAGPTLCAAILLIELLWVIAQTSGATNPTSISPTQVGISLFGPYMLGAELASFLLLAGMLGAYHLGREDY
jgi:NADH-quinone oxidoreductase subunit J